jgi:hypothetical protein
MRLSSGLTLADFYSIDRVVDLLISWVDFPASGSALWRRNRKSRSLVRR